MSERPKTYGYSRPRSPRVQPAPQSRRLGKIVLATTSMLVLGATWFGWAEFRNFTTGFSTANVLDAQAGGDQPADGSIDILLVGMDSRTDAQGNPLPQNILDQLHAGSNDGEANTDTMILIHIPNNGSKASAISIPRDSYVDIASGYGEHKINSAYAYGKNDATKQLSSKGVTGAQLAVQSDQEGAKTAIKTVEDLTGVTIDHYAQINLVGFYQLTQAIGGVDVCLKNQVRDSYSGANFPAGKQTIEGAAALAFVRQRHGLPNGDLDRIKRQQVFMSGVVQKVFSAGILTNTDKLNALADTVKKAVVLDQGWNILSFAQQLRNLSVGELQFATIPITNISLQTPEDGDAVQVDPAQVRDFVQGKTNPTSSAATTSSHDYGSIKVNVKNTTGTDGLASRVLGKLVSLGFSEGSAGTAPAKTNSVINYPSGAPDKAKEVADALGGNISLAQDNNIPQGQVDIYLGNDYSGPESGPDSQASQAASPTTSTQAPITASGITCVN